MDANHEDSVFYTEPYDFNDQTNEPRPNTVVYQEPYTVLMQLNHEGVCHLQDPLKESPYQNAITNGLLRDVQNRTKQDFPDEAMFAIAGDMESGKSTVINSILSLGIIARKGNSGGSCTFTVQRFMKMFSDQSSPFAAKVYFYSNEDIRRIIVLLFVRYFRAAGLGRDELDEAEDTEHAAQNFTDRNTTMDVFMAIFCDQDEFETRSKGEAFLAEATSEVDEDIVEALIGYAIDLVACHSEGQEFVYVSASTAADLLFTLQPYTHTPLSGESNGRTDPWPLVRVIDFGLNHPLLNEGIILVDAPGRSDANSTRADNALEWHRKCTHKMFVAQIGRITDNHALREELAREYHTRGSGNIILVLTRGDECDPDGDLSGTPLEKRQQQKLRDEKGEINKQKRSLNQKRQRPNVSQDAKDDIDQDISALTKQYRKKTRELKALCCSTRNRTVLSVLQQHYKNMTGDPKPLPAFVVGNDDYKLHQAGFSSEEQPTLSVEETNIPALRKQIYLVPAEGKLNEALHLADVQLPSLINSFELYCAKTHMARKAEIEAIIVRPLAAVGQIVGDATEQLMAQTQRLLLTPMMADEGRWIFNARQLCRKWGQKYRLNHLQMLKANGIKKGNEKKHIPTVNWNVELMQLNKGAMEDYFDLILDSPLAIYDGIAKKLGKVMDETRQLIRNDRQFNLMALDPFLRNYSSERPIMTRAVEEAKKHLRREISTIQNDLLVPSEQAYLVRAMAPVYANVRLMRGAGAPQKRIAAFEMRLTTTSGVWYEMQRTIAKSLEDLYCQNLAELSGKLAIAFEGIHTKFNLMCEDTIVKDEAEKQQEEELREKLQKGLIQAKQLLEGPLRQAADACRSYSKEKEQASLFVA